MNKQSRPKTTTTSSHWGTYRAEVRDGKLVAMHDYEKDPAPVIIGHGMVDAVDDAVRIRQPMIRKGFLEKRKDSDRSGRGREPFVAVPWDEALDIAAAELDRIRRDHGNKAIFAGSYGWASSGRFHHASSHIHRFMNCIGGYTKSVDNYSYAAGEVMTRRIVGSMKQELLDRHTTWPVLAEHCELLVMFGGMAIKNSSVTSGGVGRHTTLEGLLACRDAGCEFVNISPLETDAAPDLNAWWLAPRPGSDTAMMLALAHTLVSEGLHDKAFLARYCEGFDKFLPYLMGESDGQPKDAVWAGKLTNLHPDDIRDLARMMAAKRTMIAMAWGLQRGDHGEQVFWMGTVLAAMLGQIGLPGGGFGYGYSSENGIGNPTKYFQFPALSQGTSSVTDFIPVSRISDLLFNPGGEFDYDGEKFIYPDTRCVYWAGGNPFHHHQDLNQLVEAFRRPEVVITNEIWWTSLARHSDIVFPANTMLERNDLAMGKWEPTIVAMKKAIEPVGESRTDYEIFTGLAERLGAVEAYTEGRDEDGWLRHLWAQAMQRAGEAGFELPDFDTLWEKEIHELPPAEREPVLLDAFRADPEANPLTTATGKIEIFSETVAGFGYEDCPGHPIWMEPYEWLGAKEAEQFPLHMISNQPRTRLHSQLDSGAVSRGSKIQDREPMTLHSEDAAARGLENGDVARVFNDRGACLVGVIISDTVMKGVIQLSTGAWYDPVEPGMVGSMCKHGNPNVLTRDKGTSRLGQGPSAHSTLVEVEKFTDLLPPVTAFVPPLIEER